MDRHIDIFPAVFDSKAAHNGCRFGPYDALQHYSHLSYSSSPTNHKVSEKGPYVRKTQSFAGDRSGGRPMLNTSDVWEKDIKSHKNVLVNIVENAKCYRPPTIQRYVSSSGGILEYYDGLHLLRQTFPDLEMAIISDVYAATGYDLAESTEFLSSFNADVTKLPDDCYNGVGQVQTVASDEWIIVNDDWECLDDQGKSIPTYLEVVMQPTTHIVPRVHVSGRTPLVEANSRDDGQSEFREESPGFEDFPDIDSEFLSIKSVGQRRVNCNMKHKKTRSKKYYRK